MKVVIKQWVPVAVWKWPEIDPQDDVCGICRGQFESTCPKCTNPGISCPPAVGECSHAFHQHCIVTWLKRDIDENESGSCPMCRRKFVCEQLKDVPGLEYEEELASEHPASTDLLSS